jgi:hypothetical protein
MNERPACPLPPPPVGKYAPCPNVDEFEGTVQLSLYNTALQVFVSGRVNCLLLLFASPSSGVVKYILNNINVVESFLASGRFIKCTSTTHLLCFNSLSAMDGRDHPLKN